jgi:hypothetical protein
MKSYITIAGAVMLGAAVQAHTQADVDFLNNKLTEIETTAHSIRQELAQLATP